MYETGPDIAAQHVRSKEEQRFLHSGALNSDQMEVRRNESQEIVFVAACKEANPYFPVRICLVDSLECSQVTFSIDLVDMGAKPTVVKEVYGLRRHQGAVSFCRFRVRVGKKICAQHNDVEGGDYDSCHHRDAVLAKPPPHQLHLAGNEDSLFAVDSYLFFTYRNSLLSGHYQEDC